MYVLKYYVEIKKNIFNKIVADSGVDVSGLTENDVIKIDGYIAKVDSVSGQDILLKNALSDLGSISFNVYRNTLLGMLDYKMVED